MAHDGFRYDFTPRELAYFLFGRHRCPRCGGKLSRHRTFETVKGAEFNTRSAAPFRSESDIKHYMYVYTCENCNVSYSLSDLAQG